MGIFGGYWTDFTIKNLPNSIKSRNFVTAVAITTTAKQNF